MSCANFSVTYPNLLFSSFFTNNLKVSGLTRSQFNAIRLRNETSNESSRPAPTHDADQNCLTMKNPIKEIRAQWRQSDASLGALAFSISHVAIAKDFPLSQFTSSTSTALARKRKFTKEGTNLILWMIFHVFDVITAFSYGVSRRRRDKRYVAFSFPPGNSLR